MKRNDVFSEDGVLLILGSLNSKVEDRELSRDCIKPMQVVYNDKIVALDFFSDWGDLGLSSIVWDDYDSQTIYVTSGIDLIKIDLENKVITDLYIPNLLDVHEMTCINGEIWLANTGYDEVVVYDIANQSIKKRTKLSILRSKNPIKILDQDHESDKNSVDTFHCNQAFRGYDRNMYILVHHVSGKQIMTKFKEKILKSHGSGGVINLTTENAISLNLKAPHSVRKVQDKYWLFDSGHFALNIYDAEWNIECSLKTKGWGRGAVFSPEKKLFYAGISATRKRYFDLVPGKKEIRNHIQIFDCSTLELKGEILVNNIEQLNNLYLLSTKQFSSLSNL
jgi:hypothetical protein